LEKKKKLTPALHFGFSSHSTYKNLPLCLETQRPLKSSYRGSGETSSNMTKEGTTKWLRETLEPDYLGSEPGSSIHEFRDLEQVTHPLRGWRPQVLL